MYWQFQTKRGLSLDDIFGARMKYQPFDFCYKGISYVFIGDQDYQLAPYFKSHEFLSACSGPNFIDKRLIKPLVELRELYGPIRINSTYRTHTCNKRVGGKKNSRHLNGQAVDFQFIYESSRDKYLNEIKNKSPRLTDLQEFGINGFGAYDRHFHIDTRPRLAMWGKFVDNSSTECCE